MSRKRRIPTREEAATTALELARIMQDGPERLAELVATYEKLAAGQRSISETYAALAAASSGRGSKWSGTYYSRKHARTADEYEGTADGYRQALQELQA